MKDLTSATTFELCQRMNQINQEINKLEIECNQINLEINKLEIEHNQIIQELHNRLPHLKEDVDIQPKVLRKVKGENNG